MKLFLNQLNALMLKNNNNSIIRTIKKRKFPDSGECTHAKKQQQKCTREKLSTLPASILKWWEFSQSIISIESHNHERIQVTLIQGDPEWENRHRIRDQRPQFIQKTCFWVKEMLVSVIRVLIRDTLIQGQDDPEWKIWHQIWNQQPWFSQTTCFWVKEMLVTVRF